MYLDDTCILIGDFSTQSSTAVVSTLARGHGGRSGVARASRRSRPHHGLFGRRDRRRPCPGVSLQRLHSSGDVAVSEHHGQLAPPAAHGASGARPPVEGQHRGGRGVRHGHVRTDRHPRQQCGHAVHRAPCGDPHRSLRQSVPHQLPRSHYADSSGRAAHGCEREGQDCERRQHCQFGNWSFHWRLRGFQGRVACQHGSFEVGVEALRPRRHASDSWRRGHGPGLEERGHLAEQSERPANLQTLPGVSAATGHAVPSSQVHPSAIVRQEGRGRYPRQTDSCELRLWLPVWDLPRSLLLPLLDSRLVVQLEAAQGDHSEEAGVATW